MTEWREWSAWRQVGAAALDEVGSAVTVGTAAARPVAELARNVADHAPEAFPEPISDAVELLLDHQSVMAPIANLRNVVYLALPGGPNEVAGAAAGLGMGEGIEMAADLTAIGFDVEVLDDDAAIELLPGMDLVMAGADAIGPGSAINKTGTAALARRARAIGVPFYLVAAVEKVLPAQLFERAVGRLMRESLAEVIALDWFTAVVSDMGILKPQEVVELAAGRPVAERLL